MRVGRPGLSLAAGGLIALLLLVPAVGHTTLDTTYAASTAHRLAYGLSATGESSPRGRPPSSVPLAIAVGPSPGRPAYDPRNGYLYFPNGGGSNVSVINGTSIVGSVNVGLAPENGTFDVSDGFVYLPNYNSSNVSVLSGLSVVASIDVGKDPWSATYDPVTECVYVPNSGSGNVSVINGTSLVGTVTLGGEPRVATYDPADGLVYVPDHNLAVVDVLNGTALLQSVPVGENPLYGVYDGETNAVFVTDWGAQEVSALRGVNVSGTAGVGYFPTSPTYDATDGYLYVTNTGSNNVSVLNGTDLLTYLPTGNGPEFMAYDSGNGDVYVANIGSDTVTVLRGLYVLGTVDVGTNPEFVTYDPANGNVYVSNSGSGNVSVIASPLSYPVVFTQTGWNGSRNWNVTLNGVANRSDSAFLDFLEPNGNYSFLVTAAEFLPVPEIGTIHVNGSNASRAVVFVFSPPPTYTVTFSESGLALPSNWSVTLRGKTLETTLAYLEFSVPNGSFTFTVGAPVGELADPSHGSVHVYGNATIIPVAFATPQSPSGTGTLLGLPTLEAEELFAGVLVAAAGAALGFLLVRRRQHH